MFGRSWCPGCALIVAGVLLILLLAPDAYTVFGVLFAAIITAALLILW